MSIRRFISSIWHRLRATQSMAYLRETEKLCFFIGSGRTGSSPVVDLNKGRPLLYPAAYCFSRFEGVQLMKEHFDHIFDIHYKHLTESPERELRRVLAWLGVGISESYLQLCSKNVNPMTHSRHEIKDSWTADVRALTDEQIGRLLINFPGFL